MSEGIIKIMKDAENRRHQNMSDGQKKRRTNEIMKEIQHFKKTGVPRCFYCHKPFVNGVDSITKKVSKYLWIPTCDCVKNIRISIG